MEADFIAAIQELIKETARDESANLRLAAEIVAKALDQDRLIHLFGTGHSRLLAEEGFFRAGGLACINPVVIHELSLLMDPLLATAAERDVTVAARVFTRYRISPGDVMIVFSNSGVNAVPVEVARGARLLGAHVIAVASRRYMSQASSNHPDGLKLGDLADVLIDNHGVPGDAVLQIPGLPTRVGPASTIVGALILHAVLAGAVSRSVARGIAPPVYMSSKLPGADEHNAAIAARYRHRVAALEPTARG
ncbi:MAG: hypothetical protein A2Z07_04090 [Armatimonadetes bacterium RBG_16_67_12]|nr:MAG: hypothetical protein A2Z07_04090 [Armatimonadetes bacterium RBG_16_67_12]